MDLWNDGDEWEKKDEEDIVELEAEEEDTELTDDDLARALTAIAVTHIISATRMAVPRQVQENIKNDMEALLNESR